MLPLRPGFDAANSEAYKTCRLALGERLLPRYDSEGGGVFVYVKLGSDNWSPQLGDVGRTFLFAIEEWQTSCLSAGIVPSCILQRLCLPLQC